MVTEVLLEAPPPGTASKYRKVRERGAFDFAVAGAAVVVASRQERLRLPASS